MHDYDQLGRIHRRTPPPAPQPAADGPTAATSARAASSTAPLSPAAILGLQRMAGNASVVQLLGADEETQSPVHDVVGGGGGAPLDEGVRNEMEGRFGQRLRRRPGPHRREGVAVGRVGRGQRLHGRQRHRVPVRPVRRLVAGRPADARPRADPRRPAAERPGRRHARAGRDQPEQPVGPVRAGRRTERRRGDVRRAVRGGQPTRRPSGRSSARPRTSSRTRKRPRPDLPRGGARQRAAGRAPVNLAKRSPVERWRRLERLNRAGIQLESTPPTQGDLAQKGREPKLEWPRTRLRVLGRKSGQVRGRPVSFRTMEREAQPRSSFRAGSPDQWESRSLARRPAWREIRNELDQPLADRVRHGVRPVPQLQPRRDVVDDVLDRPLGVEEARPTSAVSWPCGEQPEHRGLALGQARERQPARRQHLALELADLARAAGRAGRAAAFPRRPPRSGSRPPCCRPSPRSGG